MSTTFNSKGWPSPGHDFGGAAQFHTLVGDLIRAANGGSWLLLYADPDHCDLLHLEPSPEYLPEIALLERPSEAGPLGKAIHWQSGERSFSRLPAEVIHLILSWLPSKDIAQLRIACSAIRRASSINQLPQAFWLSRFTPNMEMGFAKSYHYEHHPLPNWRNLFFTVRHAIRKPDDHLRLKNRKRVR